MRMSTALAAFLLALCSLAQDAQANWNPEWTKRAKVTLNTSAEGVPISAPMWMKAPRPENRLA